jgi:hypothetical protein
VVRRLAFVARTGLLLVVGALLIGYLVAVTFGAVATDNRLSTPEILLGIAIFAAILVSDQLSLYSVKDLSLGPGGITANFERIAARQNALESDVRALQVAISGLVTKFEVVHLEKLATDGPAVVRFGEIMLSELTHLDAMGFIVPLDHRGLNALRHDHGSGLTEFDLKAYAAITQEGREYLGLRAHLGA